VVSKESTPTHESEPVEVRYPDTGSGRKRVVTRGLAAPPDRTSAATEPSELDGFADWWASMIKGPRVEVPRAGVPLRFVDLFSSVGGLSLGAADAIQSVGRRPIPLLAADTDQRALQVYKANLRPREALVESVKGMLDFRVSGAGADARFAYDPQAIDPRLSAYTGQVDLLLAGPPCQGHSSLNNHSRHQDPKNLLYLTVPAAAVALGARHVVIENVPNVVADKHGVVQTAKTLLTNAGYKISSGVLRADQLGWPQTRKRFFMVASLESQPLDLSELSRSLRRAPQPVSWLLEDLRSQGLDDTDVMNSVPRLSEENEMRVNWLFDNEEHNLPNEIRPDCHKAGTTYSATYGRMFANLPAPTITGGFLTPGRGRFVHPTERRVLTPREAARVQGFPDWFNFSPNPATPPLRTEVSKWIGNAVPSILSFVATYSAIHGEGLLESANQSEVKTHAA